MKNINLENNLELKKFSCIFFSIILVGFLIRIFYTHFESPLSLDALDYFLYSIAINHYGFFPDGYLQHNFGWSTIISPIFLNYQNYSMLELMNIQRIAGVIISCITIIPLYFLVKNFFSNKISLIVSSIFLFEPRIILNSSQGITDPIYILFLTLCILFIFFKNGKYFVLSFLFIALSGFIRYEGLILIVPLIISFFIKRNFNKNNLINFLIGLLVYSIIIIIINQTFYEENENIYSPLIGSSNYFTYTVISNNIDPDDKFFSDNSNNNDIFIKNFLLTGGKYAIWLMIPTLGIFLILGLIFSSKKISRNKLVLFTFLFFIGIISYYAYGRGIQEMRYLYSLIPILVIISGYVFRFLIYKINFYKIIFTIFVFLIVSSVIFIEYQDIDKKFDFEVYEATKYLLSLDAKGVNEYEGNKFIRTAELDYSWPDLPPLNEKKKMDISINKISLENDINIQSIIEKYESVGLTHLVITENENNQYLKDLIHQHPLYLIKKYDSRNFSKENLIIIFEIDYNLIK